MQSINQLQSNGYYRADQNGGLWYQGNDGYVLRRYCSPGAMVHGNKHAPNPWTYDARTVWFPRGTVIEDYPTIAWQQSYSGFFPGAFEPDGWPYSSRDLLYNRALSRLNEKVRGGTDLGVSLAELAQTKRMLAELAKMANYANFSGFGTYRDLVNGFLQWKYGWKPLMSDLFGAANESLSVALKTIQKIRSSATETISGRTFQSIPFFHNSWPAINSHSGKMSCRFEISLEVSGFDLARWTSLNPVTLAWELIPYSFVIDWVYDIGGFLRDVETSFLYNLAFKGGYVSELYACDTWQVVPAGTDVGSSASNPPSSIRSLGIRAKARRRKFARSVLMSYPLPRSPSFRLDLGSEQVLTFAALLSQLVRR